jgi:hypothetical protein
MKLSNSHTEVERKYAGKEIKDYDDTWYDDNLARLANSQEIYYDDDGNPIDTIGYRDDEYR